MDTIKKLPILLYNARLYNEIVRIVGSLNKTKIIYFYFSIVFFVKFNGQFLFTKFHIKTNILLKYLREFYSSIFVRLQEIL